MSSIVELARMPELMSVSLADNTADEEVKLPGGLTKFVIYTSTEDTTIYWAVESGQVTDASGDRRTVPPGTMGGADRLYVPNGASIYLGASEACIVELEVYTKY